MKKNNKKTIDLWKENYAHDQENLYKNKLIQTLFDLGHRYIARQGESITGTILDIGSGMGYHLKFEKISNERKYICLDNDPKMLQKIRNKKVEKIVGNCSNIPLKDKSVDLVIASHILEHLPTLKNDLSEIRRVLKDDGRLIVVLPCDPGFLWNTATHMSPSRRRLKKIGIDYDEVMKHEHVNTFEKCVSELEGSFKIQDRQYYPFLIQNHNFNLICGFTFTK